MSDDREEMRVRIAALEERLAGTQQALEQARGAAGETRALEGAVADVRRQIEAEHAHQPRRTTMQWLADYKEAREQTVRRERRLGRWVLVFIIVVSVALLGTRGLFLFTHQTNWFTHTFDRWMQSSRGDGLP